MGIYTSSYHIYVIMNKVFLQIIFRFKYTYFLFFSV